MDKLNTLTKREEEILNLIIDGKTNPDIAKIMNISIHTVKAHIESIYRKMEVHNKVQAVVKAIYYKKI